MGYGDVVPCMKELFLRALTALAYIGVVASVIYFVPRGMAEPHPIVSISAFLSLFTLSAGVMAYLFFWRPFALLIARKEKEASIFFLQTLGSFAVLLLVLFGIVVVIGV